VAQATPVPPEASIRLGDVASHLELGRDELASEIFDQ